MCNDLFELYSRCFYGIVREDDKVRNILNMQGNTVLTRKVYGKLAAASVVNGNVVLMLCVLPEFRNRGIGSELLSETEELVRRNGYSEIRFCDGPEYITPGVPMYPGSWEFFLKRGYAHSWEDSECVDMSMELSDFNYNEHSLGDTINGVEYRWGRVEEMAAVVNCVNHAEEEFAPYYNKPESYSNDSRERVLVAAEGNRICGALIVCLGVEKDGVGSVGCTATRDECQGRGIATNMVRLGTRFLKEYGLTSAFLGYTYTEIVHMYGRSGYKVCMKYMMAVKEF